MIKVECPSCKASYDLDERRIPQKGMNMRCPKCGARFLVAKSGGVTPPPGGATPSIRPTMTSGPPPAEAAAPPPQPPPTKKVMKATMVGAPGMKPPPPPPVPPSPPRARPPIAPAFQPKPRAEQAAAPAATPTNSDQTSQQNASSAKAAGQSAATPEKPSKLAARFPSAMAVIEDLPTPKAQATAPLAPPFPAGNSARTQATSPQSGDDNPQQAPAKAIAMPIAANQPSSQFKETELDLPALKRPKTISEQASLEATSTKNADLEADFGDVLIDLPAVKNDEPKNAEAEHIDLPTPKSGARATDIDLPTPKQDASEASFDDVMVDLPTVKQGVGEEDFGDVMVDLPTTKQTAGEEDFGDVMVDLPDPPSIELDTSNGAPSANTSASQPEAKPIAPDPSFGRASSQPAQGRAARSKRTIAYDEFPVPEASSATTASAANEHVSAAAPALDDKQAERDSAQFSFDATPDQDAQSLGHAATIFGISNPAAQAELEAAPPPAALSHEAGFGDIDLGDDLGPGGALSLHPSVDTNAAGIADTEPPPEPAAGQGELHVGDDQVAPPQGDAHQAREGMEFGIDSDNETFSLPPEALRRVREGAGEDTTPPRGSRAVRILVGALLFLLLLSGAGVGVGMFTPYGYFGVYYLERFLPEAGTPQQAKRFIKDAERIATSDTYLNVSMALKMLGAARGKLGLNRELLTRSVIHECLAVLRFGDSPQADAHVAAIMRRLEERGGLAPQMQLARAADSARRKQWAEAAQLVQDRLRQAPQDPYPSLLAGEIALAQSEGKSAKGAFEKALELGGGARAQWGLARAAQAMGDLEALRSATDATLKLSPRHVDARVTQARLEWQGDGDTAKLSQSIAQALGTKAVSGTYLWPSKPSRAEGYTVLGYAQEVAGHSHLARQAYDAALAADPNRQEALLGAGRVMLRDRHYRDAQARFEAAANASKSHDPVMLSGRQASVEAQLGMGRTLLALGHVPEAEKVLSELATRFPKDAEIARAYGQVQEAQGDVDHAETEYRRAIENAPTSFDGYLALSQLYSHTDRADEASEVLAEAAQHVQESAQMRRTQGLAELARNRLDSAETEFKRALELDSQDLDSRFGLAQTLRRAGKLAQAKEALLQVQKADETYQGLSMEQGLLQEAEGHYEEAISAYQEGLKRDESDMQLWLRLGAAQVAAAKLDAADTTLRKVLKETPNSAEGEYFAGRIAFARERTPDALTHFDRALALDSNQAEFHLYAGRASLDMGNLGRALEEANLAIERDPSMGDAFWVRGDVRLRMGAVQDALNDFQEVLKFNPGRVEAYAGMASAYEQMGELPKAIESYAAAASKAPDRGDFWVRLAQAQQDAGRSGKAEESLKHALALDKLGDTDEAPAWLVEAYRMRGDLAKAGQQKKAAVDAYLRYLKLAPDGHVDRKAVERQLKRWKVPLND